jgi:hypothetical protein
MAELNQVTECGAIAYDHIDRQNGLHRIRRVMMFWTVPIALTSSDFKRLMGLAGVVIVSGK